MPPLITRTPSNSESGASGGLQLPTNIGLSTSELQTLLQRFSTMHLVEEHLVQQGLYLDMVTPKDAMPTVTAETLSETNPDKYNQAYTEQLAWYNYFTPHHARAKAALLQAQNQLVLVEAAIKKRIIEVNKLRKKDEKLSADEVKTEVLTDPSYRDALLEEQTKKQHELMVAACLEVADRNMKVISRAIEVRRIEFDSSKRDTNLGKAAGPSSAGKPVGSGFSRHPIQPIRR